MSLSYDDLQAIRSIVEGAVSPIRGDIAALNNDVKDMYEMISGLQKDIKISVKSPYQINNFRS